MRFVKDTLSFIFQVLLIIFVNLFVADLTFSILIMTLYYYVNDNCDICGILSVMLFILKFISLPILYKVLYEKSKNKIILGFIQLLKTNLLFKIFILFLTLIPENLLFSKKFKLFEILLYIYISLFGSYLFLFLWWEVEKWWKREKDKGNKYVCAVCECCVKFRSNFKALLNKKCFKVYNLIIIKIPKSQWEKYN